MNDLIKAIEKAGEFDACELVIRHKVEINKKDHWANVISGAETQHSELQWAVEALKIAVERLSKIEDPRLRDHKEPDAYTELGCVMNIATEALEQIAALVPRGEK